MKYDYGVYFRQNCIIPLLILLFLAFIFARCSYNLIARITLSSFMESLKKNAKTGILLLVCFLLICINAIILLRGGIYLLFEKEADAVEISGVIEHTVEIDGITGGKYGVKNNYGRGEALIIDGKKYYLTTYGDLKVGDRVVMLVLPKSKFVLEIKKATQ